MKKLLLVAIILLAAALRFYKLGSVPPALYWDEASLGYNAYSILKTAHDEHGRFLPLTNFAAFGDYKPPGYIYAAVGSVALFGLNEFGIRFPSAFFGTLTVLLTYFLTKKLFSKDRDSIAEFTLSEVEGLQNDNEKKARGTRGTLDTLALLAALLLAISPWHIHMSRAAFEANLGLFFSTLGIYLFIKFAKDNKFWILPSILSFLVAMYTFTGQRLFVPLILVVLAVQFRKQIIANVKTVVVTAVIASILFWPLFIFATQTIEGQLRFNEVTIFKDLEPIDRSVRYREKDDYSWYSQVIHNRRLLYAREYLIHYFDAFNPSFLFTRGDANPRLSPQDVGELYFIDLPLILAGIYFLFSQKVAYRWLIVGWLLVSPLGPATARETPHALRMIHILPTFQILSAFGFYTLYQTIKLKKVFVTLIFLFLIFNFFFYLHMYYLHWPKNYSDQWQYGYKQAVEVAKNHYDNVDKIIVTKSLGRPYIYFLLYTQFDPNVWRQTAQVVRDQFYFIDVGGFDKFIFSGNPKEIAPQGRTLYIVTPGQLPVSAAKITTITDLSGKSVFDIGIVE